MLIAITNCQEMVILQNLVFCFYGCLAKCGIIQRYKNYVNQKGEKHEIKLYEDLIKVINSYNNNN